MEASLSKHIAYGITDADATLSMRRVTLPPPPTVLNNTPSCNPNTRSSDD
jgi:hypothetical protein